MKKLITLTLAIGSMTMLTACNMTDLHTAYQKTKDSYAFVKGAYSQVREDAKVVLQDVQDAAENLQQDLHYAGKDWDNAMASIDHSIDTFKGCTTLKEYSEKE